MVVAVAAPVAATHPYRGVTPGTVTIATADPGFPDTRMRSVNRSPAGNSTDPASPSRARTDHVP